MKHLVIINHQSVKHNEKLIALLDSFFKSIHQSYDIFNSYSIKQCQDYINKLDKPTRIYLCGGDGSLHHLINLIHHSHHELLLLPCGTGNDFSRMLNAHKKLKQHLLDSLNNQFTSIDLMRINQSYAINTACMGVDADIANHVHDLNHPLIPRKLLYLISTLRRFFIYQPNYISLSIDNKLVYEGEIFFLTCNNAKYYGGGFCFTKQAKLDDGLLDICLIKPFPKYQLLYKCIALILKQPQILKQCEIYQGKHLEITSKQGINLDGENYNYSHITIDVMPKALNILNKIKT